MVITVNIKLQDFEAAIAAGAQRAARVNSPSQGGGGGNYPRSRRSVSRRNTYYAGGGVGGVGQSPPAPAPAGERTGTALLAFLLSFLIVMSISAIFNICFVFTVSNFTFNSQLQAPTDLVLVVQYFE